MLSDSSTFRQPGYLRYLRGDMLSTSNRKQLPTRQHIGHHRVAVVASVNTRRITTPSRKKRHGTASLDEAQVEPTSHLLALVVRVAIELMVCRRSKNAVCRGLNSYRINGRINLCLVWPLPALPPGWTLQIKRIDL